MKPACFGKEHGLKSACKVCWYNKECEQEYIAQDGRNPEPIETHIDDPRYEPQEPKDEP